MIVRSLGAVTLATLALVLAACSSETAGGPADPPESSAASTGPAAPNPAGSDSIKPAVKNPFETKGFTIRYLDNGHVKKIDVPDFEH